MSAALGAIDTIFGQTTLSLEMKIVLSYRAFLRIVAAMPAFGSMAAWAGFRRGSLS